MKLHRILGLVLAVQLVRWPAPSARGVTKLKPSAPRRPMFPQPSRARSDTQGVRVIERSGAPPLCEIWLRKTLSTNATPNASSDVLFGSAGGRDMVGVLHFPNAATDFRSQTIKAGFYTLRYALIPQDGNHMGVNPSRDAFVMSPRRRQNPDKMLSLEDLVKLSGQASGTPHPGFLVERR